MEILASIPITNAEPGAKLKLQPTEEIAQWLPRSFVTEKTRTTPLVTATTLKRIQCTNLLTNDFLISQIRSVGPERVPLTMVARMPP
jgi:hypothetical protein